MFRRNFLRQLGLIGAVFSLPHPILAGSQNPSAIKKPQEILLKGCVSCMGKGIAGVAVTDGNHIVLTDTKGNYAFRSQQKNGFVYISNPAGYAFNHLNGTAKFYKRFEGDAHRFEANFELEKLKDDDNKHCFVVWADPQILTKADAKRLKTETAPDLKALVEASPLGTLWHGIGCGDLVWDKFDLFDDYKEAVSYTGVPFFNVIGNHDMDFDARTDEGSARTFETQFGPTYYSFNRGKLHYVVLDDVFYIGNSGKYIGYLNENQLSWLEKDLSLVPTGSTVIVSLHIPTNTGAARREKRAEGLTNVVSNRQQLYKILAPYKTHIMSGHTHYNENWEVENLMEHNHGTVCGAWWTGPVCDDGTPAGYGVYEVEGDDLKWYYKSTGLPKTEQIRLYKPGADAANSKELVANVWNWDAKWKVEWWQDDQPMGAMLQRVGLDPDAVKLYTGPNLPGRHQWIEPGLTDHLFYATPSANAKRITVKSTDRFGEVFESNLIL